MKELTEEIKLDPDKITRPMLPIEDCLFWDDDEDSKFYHSLTGIIAGDYPFRALSGSLWKNCAQLITRYPRDVHERVAELPDDKPFLAYISGSKLPKKDFPENTVYAYCPVNEEWPHDPESEIFPWIEYAAIDVSTQWAAENFPEIVEAMEYQALSIVFCPDSQPLELHKLGNKIYDLEWNEFNETEAKEDISAKLSSLSKTEQTTILEAALESSVNDKTSCDSESAESDPQEEPPDLKNLLTSICYEEGDNFHRAKMLLTQGFNTGNSYGKWKTNQHWKNILKKVGLEIK